MFPQNSYTKSVATNDIIPTNEFYLKTNFFPLLLKDSCHKKSIATCFFLSVDSSVYK